MGDRFPPEYASLVSVATPTLTSYFFGATGSEYFLRWRHGGRGYIETVSDQMLPVASFEYRQRERFQIELDGSKSRGVGLRFQWQVGDRSRRQWQTIGRGSNLTHDFRESGVFPVRLTVRDSNGIEANQGHKISVTAGHVPVVSDLTCAPTGEGTRFSMQADFSDEDGDIQAVQWFTSTSPEARPAAETQGNRNRVTLSAPADSSFVWARVKVLDERGNEATRNCRVEFDSGPHVPRISNVSAVEGESLVFMVALDRPPARPVTYYYAPYRDTADSDDYTGRPATALTFDSGEIPTKTITVRTTDDRQVENDEKFHVFITDERNQHPERGEGGETPSEFVARATGIIHDDDELGTLPAPRISDATAVEGESLVFTVELSPTPKNPVTYYYATYRGSAGRDDYDGRTATPLHFSASERSKPITIPTTDDAEVEGDEEFFVYLTKSRDQLTASRPRSYLAQATGTIHDNDAVSGCSGDRAALVTFYSKTGGDDWRYNDGWLTAEDLSDWRGVSTEEGCVYNLNARGFGLTGTIPPELGNLSRLRYLELGNNRLTGTIPPELGQLSRLEGLYFDYNQLTGTIPPELGNLSRLRVLWFQNNQLTGAVPPELGNLLRLENLLLDNNQLTGAIPPELGNLSRLRFLHLDNNQLTGTIPPELGSLSRLEWLWLDNNQLTGTLPRELGDLSNLLALVVHNNQLTGVLPVELTNLRMLRGFFFSGNDGLCAPNSERFQMWLQQFAEENPGPTCEIPLPSAPSISNASAKEGETVVFTVRLDRAPVADVTYYFSTHQVSGGALGNGEDYHEHDATPVTFFPGETSKSIGVRTVQDTKDEDDETFQVYLMDSAINIDIYIGAPQNYLARATGTIRDDDTAPIIRPISTRSVTVRSNDDIPTIGVIFDGQSRLELVAGVDRTVEQDPFLIFSIDVDSVFTGDPRRGRFLLWPGTFGVFSTAWTGSTVLRNSETGRQQIGPLFRGGTYIYEGCRINNSP